MVCLASRPRGGYYRNLGRETYLVPFIWEDGWPVINPGKGILEDTFPMPDLPAYEAKEIPAKEDFDAVTQSERGKLFSYESSGIFRNETEC